MKNSEKLSLFRKGNSNGIGFSDVSLNSSNSNIERKLQLSFVDKGRLELGDVLVQGTHCDIHWNCPKDAPKDGGLYRHCDNYRNCINILNRFKCDVYDNLTDTGNSSSSL